MLRFFLCGVGVHLGSLPLVVKQSVSGRLWLHLLLTCSCFRLACEARFLSLLPAMPHNRPLRGLFAACHGCGHTLDSVLKKVAPSFSLAASEETTALFLRPHGQSKSK